MATKINNFLETLTGEELLVVRNEIEVWIRSHEYPRLFVTKKGNVKCPVCGEKVSADNLRAISEAEDWSYANEFDTVNGVVEFWAPDESPELGETIVYTHGDNPGHPVRLPEDWTESWS